jgi:hypothetical protein
MKIGNSAREKTEIARGHEDNREGNPEFSVLRVCLRILMPSWF